MLLRLRMSDIKLCKSITQAITAAWKKPDQHGMQIAVRFSTLAAILFRQNEGKQGAGLTGGKQQEDLFRDMLLYSDKRFSEKGTLGVKDADYYFNNFPISHKTIGYNGNGDLALAWSKNGPGGLVRNKFHASMVIMCFRNLTKNGPLKGQLQGAYVVPRDWLQANISFKSNNKTDSLISASEIARAMAFAKSKRLFVPLAYQHGAGGAARVSLWYSGAGKDLLPLDPL